MQRPALSALNCLFVHHLAAQPESLGIIAWLLHCGFLAACAKEIVVSRPRLIVAMNTQTLCLPFVPNNLPECLINMLAYAYAYTLSSLSS